MKVILLEDIEKLGDFGATVEVADGYARNYLIPKRLALRATPENVRLVERERKLRDQRAGKVRARFEELKERIEKLSCTIVKQVGENDRLFGSVTSMDIAKYLKQEGIEVDKKSILLKEPLKTLGVYTVPIKLHPEVTANLKVWVVKE